MHPDEFRKLAIFADEIRLESLRAMAAYGSGHVGGVFSMAELLAVLYGAVMRTDPARPRDPARDKLVLSKGHCGPGVQAALAIRGFFPLADLQTLNRDGTKYPSHLDMRKTPGVDMSTGSLGQGASAAAGLALADRLAGRDAYTYLILGDGECDEGQVWEMALFAAQQRLRNLVAFVDRNRQQLDGETECICALGDVAGKFRSFGWRAVTAAGHDVAAIVGAIEEIRAGEGCPGVIVLDTVKGRGWSRLEGKPNVHHTALTPALAAEAEGEIAGRLAALKH